MVDALPRVLVVDDDEASRRLVSVALRDHRVEVVSCADPTAVVDLVREWRPVAIVLDVMMPGLDGPGVIRRLRAADLDAPPRIVLWSAMAAGALARLAEECGADAVVLKIAGPRVLVDELERWL